MCNVKAQTLTYIHRLTLNKKKCNLEIIIWEKEGYPNNLSLVIDSL